MYEAIEFTKCFLFLHLFLNVNRVFLEFEAMSPVSTL